MTSETGSELRTLTADELTQEAWRASRDCRSIGARAMGLASSVRRCTEAAGRVRRAERSDLPSVEAFYERQARLVNGHLDRS